MRETMQKKPSLLIALVAVAALLTACASVDVTKTSKGFHQPTEASSVDILKTLPAKPYEELGTVTVTGFSADETAKMHNAIRTKASVLGANAVVLTDEGIIKDGWTLQRWATGVAIAFKQ